MLEVEKLVCGYGNLPVLHGLDFKIGDHESVAILGANGAGKSTFLRAISRSLPVISGVIRWRDTEVQSWPAWRAAQTGIGYVPQDHNVFPAMTVYENLALAAESRPDGRAQLAEFIDRFPILEARAKQLAGTLSGGERQLVALVSALLMDPKLLLLDEPTTGLAPIVVENLSELIRQVVTSGVAVVWVVEQDPAVALKIVDRAYTMAAGEFVAELPKERFEDRRTLEELLTGAAQT